MTPARRLAIDILIRAQVIELQRQAIEQAQKIVKNTNAETLRPTPHPSGTVTPVRHPRQIK
jgi:hypothetical protein